MFFNNSTEINRVALSRDFVEGYATDAYIHELSIFLNNFHWPILLHPDELAKEHLVIDMVGRYLGSLSSSPY